MNDVKAIFGIRGFFRLDHADLAGAGKRSGGRGERYGDDGAVAGRAG